MKQNHKGVKIYFELYLLIAVLVIAGCSSIQNVLTEDEAKLLVLDNHYNHNGKTEIISV